MSWLVIAIVGLMTFALRSSFLLPSRGRLGKTWQDALSFAPVAVLPVLALSLVIGDGEGPVGLRALAALVGAGVAWLTRSFMLALVIGMLTIWLLLYSF